MLKEVCLLTFTVCLISAERIYNQGDRSPTFDRDQEEQVRTSRLIPAGGKDQDLAASGTRSSFLDRFTTERPAGSYSGGSPYDRNRDREGNWDVTHRRPSSYVTDRYGDVVSGGGAAAGGGVTSRPYGYVTMYTTQNWRDRDSVTHSWDSRRTESPWGSSGSSISGPSRGSISGPSSANRDRFDAYLRIQFELVKLTNEKGVNIDGAKCDTFGSCDTVCYAYIDTDRPNAEFPGSRDMQHFTKLYETDDNNSPQFTRANVTREVCGSPYREAVARVYCEDHDSLSQADIINKWDCPINRDPETAETFASWTSGECRTRFQADKMKLTYRYKIYGVPRSRCDPTVGNLPLAAGATTKRRT